MYAFLLYFRVVVVVVVVCLSVLGGTEGREC